MLKNKWEINVTKLTKESMEERTKKTVCLIDLVPQFGFMYPLNNNKMLQYSVHSFFLEPQWIEMLSFLNFLWTKFVKFLLLRMFIIYYFSWIYSEKI